MKGTFYRVSGLDPHDSANIVFVWCRVHDQENRILVGSGHVVTAASGAPPGIRVGQFCVVFMLPPDCSASSIVVTHDKDGKSILPDISIMQCSPGVGYRPAAISASAAPAA
ncbi:hypothetical protein [Xanthobacter autotrophicus]|uniref:hypothetical protein n=1 Tax=Xanthobacter autotrophicus TaxID=280 RepID=UPI00372AA8EA